jgi:hypothetical protein
MATSNDFSRGFTVNTAMSAFIRVTVSLNGAIGPSGAEQGQGVLQQDVAGNSYDVPKVRFFGTGSCQIAVTGNGTTAITPGATLGTTLLGYVCVSPYTNVWGIALQGSGTNTGSVIEALPAF